MDVYHLPIERHTLCPNDCRSDPGERFRLPFFLYTSLHFPFNSS